MHLHHPDHLLAVDLPAKLPPAGLRSGHILEDLVQLGVHNLEQPSRNLPQSGRCGRNGLGRISNGSLNSGEK
jgi:hypothetical protein